MMCRSSTVLAVLLCAVLAGPTEALEIQGRIPASDARHHEWSASSTINLAYYNFNCLGWIFIAGPFGPGGHIGVQFDNPSPGAKLAGSWMYFDEGAPFGYGYTGTIEVHDADANDCPIDPPLAVQPLAPTRGWNYFVWPEVGVQESFTVSVRAPATGAPWYVWFNQPFCGLPPEPHTFGWGSDETGPLCPGVAKMDYELVLDAQLTVPTDLGERSWARVKNLFR